MRNGRGTHPHTPDVARMNIHQASQLVSNHLILLLTLISSIPCLEMRFQRPTGM